MQSCDHYITRNTPAQGVTAFPHLLGFPHGIKSQTIDNFLTEAMASSSSAPLNPFLGQATSEKLGKGNHALWKAQVLAVVRGARLEDFLTGAAKAPEQKIKEDNKEVPNPLYEQWKATNQQVLGYLLLNMSTPSFKFQSARQQPKSGRSLKRHSHRSRRRAPSTSGLPSPTRRKVT
jgi:hypothetical protein